MMKSRTMQEVKEDIDNTVKEIKLKPLTQTIKRPPTIIDDRSLKKHLIQAIKACGKAIVRSSYLLKNG